MLTWYARGGSWCCGLYACACACMYVVVKTRLISHNLGLRLPQSREELRQHNVFFFNKTRCFRSSFSTHCRANPTPLINGDDRLIWGRLMIRFELSAGVASCPFDAFFDAPFPRFWANWKNFRLGSTCLLSLYSHVFVEQADKHWSGQSIIAGTVSYSFC